MNTPSLCARLGAVVLAASVTAGCSSSSGPSATSVGKQLAARLFPTPTNYQVENTPGSHGYMDAGAFDAMAASSKGAAERDHFRGGFRQDYVNASLTEGISITLLQFSNDQAANSYFRFSLRGALSVYAAHNSLYGPIPGAIEFTGSQAYQGNWAHAVLAAKGRRMMVFTYIDTAQGPVPYEFSYWVKSQYNRI